MLFLVNTLKFLPSKWLLSECNTEIVILNPVSFHLLIYALLTPEFGLQNKYNFLAQIYTIYGLRKEKFPILSITLEQVEMQAKQIFSDALRGLVLLVQ